MAISLPRQTTYPYIATPLTASGTLITGVSDKKIVATFFGDLYTVYPSSSLLITGNQNGNPATLTWGTTGVFISAANIEYDAGASITVTTAGGVNVNAAYYLK
jgi:hypothetical protein